MTKQEQWYPNMAMVVVGCVLGGLALAGSFIDQSKPLPTPPPAATPSGSPEFLTILGTFPGTLSAKSVGLYVGGASLFWKQSRQSKDHTPVLIEEEPGEVVFTIKDGDEPQGPGCDFGLLVRLAKWRDGARTILSAEDARNQAAFREQLRVCSPKEAK